MRGRRGMRDRSRLHEQRRTRRRAVKHPHGCSRGICIVSPYFKSQFVTCPRNYPELPRNYSQFVTCPRNSRNYCPRTVPGITELLSPTSPELLSPDFWLRVPGVIVPGLLSRLSQGVLKSCRCNPATKQKTGQPERQFFPSRQTRKIGQSDQCEHAEKRGCRNKRKNANVPQPQDCIGPSSRRASPYCDRHQPTRKCCECVVHNNYERKRHRGRSHNHCSKLRTGFSLTLAGLLRLVGISVTSVSAAV
jgi:hypothetical protein